jgi:hypothetical protein
MRLEVNTSGSWKAIGEIDPDQLDQVRDACEVIARLDESGKRISFRLTNLMRDGKTRYRAESMVKGNGHQMLAWETRL